MCQKLFLIPKKRSKMKIQKRVGEKVIIRNMKNNCKGSIGTINVNGNKQVYQFCLHKIDIKEKNIDLTNKLDSQRPLNDYGKGLFCKFRIQEHLDGKGLYCFVVDKKLKYIGQTISTFRQRINAGYGNISPYNCYVGGQRTNCHVNSLINDALNNKKEVLVGFYVMSDDVAIKKLEKELIKETNLVCKGWNLQK